MFAIILAVGLAAATPALAWNEPGEFRGVPFGASVEEARAKAPTLVCVPPMGSCREFFELGSTRVYGFWTFRNGGFDQIDLTFPASGHPDVKGVFVARFGDPTSTRAQAMRPGDPPLENEILEWSGDRAYVELRRFHRRTEQGTATIRTRAGLEEAVRRRPGGAKSE